MSLSRLNHTFFSHPRWAGMSNALGCRRSHFLASRDSRRAQPVLKERDLSSPFVPIDETNHAILPFRVVIVKLP